MRNGKGLVLLSSRRDLLLPFAPGAKSADTFLDEIPEPVLQELSALAVIHLGKGLLASAPQKWQPGIEHNTLYRVLFRWIAPALYNFNQLRRTQPDAVIVLNTVILAGCFLVMAVVVLLVLWGGLTHTMHAEHWHLGFVACAAVALLAIWGFFLRR